MREFSILFFSCAFLISTATADTVRLKDGSILEGAILTEDSSQITMEVRYAGGTITRNQTIKKSDIVEIKRLSPEEKARQQMELAYRATQKFNLNPNSSQPLAAYEPAIQSLQDFLSKYPESPYAREVSGKLAVWKAERDQVASGSAKYRGEWMPASEAARRSKPIEPVLSAAPAKQSVPEPPPPPALLAQVGDMLKNYWVFALIGVVGMLWLVTRLFTRD
jgi:hypothetical protein